MNTGKNSEHNFKNGQCRSNGIAEENEEEKVKMDIGNLPTLQD